MSLPVPSQVARRAVGLSAIGTGEVTLPPSAPAAPGHPLKVQAATAAAAAAAVASQAAASGRPILVIREGGGRRRKKAAVAVADAADKLQLLGDDPEVLGNALYRLVVVAVRHRVKCLLRSEVDRGRRRRWRRERRRRWR